MDSVLIVAGTDKGREMLTGLCRSDSFSRITTVSSGNEARRLLIGSSFDLVVINAPLPDEFGHELAVSAAQDSCTGVMLLVKSELADEVSARVEDDGVFVLAKPVSRPLFFQSLKLITASCKRLRGISKQKMLLETKIEEIRLIDRAKCVLIQYLSMTEPQAHRYIEKQAMDLRLPKRVIAENILNTYET